MAKKPARRKASPVNRARRAPRKTAARRRSPRRMNRAKSDVMGTALRVLTIGAAAFGMEMAKGALRPYVKNAYLLNGGTTALGIAAAAFSKPGVIQDIGIGVGVSGAVGLGGQAMAALGVGGVSLQGARGTLTEAETVKIVRKLKDAAAAHRLNGSGMPQTLNGNGSPATLNASYDGMTTW